MSYSTLENFSTAPITTAVNPLGRATAITQNLKSNLCQDVRNTTCAITMPVGDAIIDGCNAVKSQIRGVCDEIGQAAYDWGTDTSFFPSHFKQPMKDAVVNRCHSAVDGIPMCNWVPGVKSDLEQQLITQGLSALSCPTSGVQTNCAGTTYQLG